MASPFEVYTITPLNNGLVNGGIFTDAPAPGNATKAAKALEGLNAARDLYNSISQLTNQVEVIKVQENLEH
jgi:hypothetical protein